VRARDTSGLAAHLSATPTPRESIVFSRGEERPIAKILLHSAKSSADHLGSDSEGRSSQERERERERDFRHDSASPAASAPTKHPGGSSGSTR
jgi:hypothetical protein